MSNFSFCMQKIKEGIQYAGEPGHVTNYNWKESLRTKTVVAFGLGKFMEDTHERLFSMLDIQYLCDNNKSLWGGTSITEKSYHRMNLIR